MKAIATKVLMLDDTHEYWYTPDHYKVMVRVVAVEKTGTDQLCFDLLIIHVHSGHAYRERFYIDDIDDYIALGKVPGSVHETINKRLVARRFLDQLELMSTLPDDLWLDHFGEEVTSILVAPAEEREHAMKM